MDPITTFVVKYGPDIIKSKPASNLQQLCFQKVDEEKQFEDLDDLTKVDFLVNRASIANWYEKSQHCSPQIMNTAAKVLLGRFGFRWINEKNAFQKLLGHLFDQALNSPKVTKEEVDALIQFKRTQQNKVRALSEKTLSVFERAILGVSYVWRYQPTLNINVNIPYLNIPVQQQIPNIPVVPVLYSFTCYAFIRFYFLPKQIDKWMPRGINFLINHLPAKVFPMYFKVYDVSWWLDWLPYISVNPGNRFPVLRYAIYSAQLATKGLMKVMKLPEVIAQKTSLWCFRGTNVVVPVLEKMENYSEMTRYRREINEVRDLWITRR